MVVESLPMAVSTAAAAVASVGSLISLRTKSCRERFWSAAMSTMGIACKRAGRSASPTFAAALLSCALSAAFRLSLRALFTLASALASLSVAKTAWSNFTAAKGMFETTAMLDSCCKGP